MIESAKNEKQLEIIRNLNTLFTSSHLRHWLFGGWSVDFMVGKVTRSHLDIDFAVYHTDRTRINFLMKNAGFSLCHHANEEEFSKWSLGEYRVDLVYFSVSADNHVARCGRLCSVQWPPDSFEFYIGGIGNVRCPVVSPYALLTDKMNYHLHPSGAPLREKDQMDIKWLLELTGQVEKQDLSI